MKPALGSVLYLSGPMSGLDDLNRPAFAAAAAALRAIDYRVVNPHEIHPSETTWEQAMRADIRALMDCDAVALLPGWRRSRGATIEAWIARQLGMPLYTVGELLPTIVFVPSSNADSFEQADYLTGRIAPFRVPAAMAGEAEITVLVRNEVSSPAPTLSDELRRALQADWQV